MAKCIERGATRVNVNKLVLSNYDQYVKESAGKVPLTELMGHGSKLIQAQCEEWMDHIGSSGKA